MELSRAFEVLEYNRDMLTCDMSISRDPEHQDVSPDYYGKDAENLYYAIVCVEEYIKNAIPIEWWQKQVRKALDEHRIDDALCLIECLNKWRDEKNDTENN